VCSVAVSPDGKRIAFNTSRSFATVSSFDIIRNGMIGQLDSDGTIRLESTGNDSKRITLDVEHADIRSLALAPDGSRLVTGGPGRTVTIWDTRPDPSVRTFVDSAGPASLSLPEVSAACIALSPDGQKVASAGGARPIRIRDLETGRVLFDFGDQPGSIQTIAYSPDGRYIAAGGTEKLIHIWDAGSGHERITIKGHGAPVGRIAFSPDGTALAAAGLGGLVRVWDVKTGLERFRIPVDSSATSVAFSPDGTMLASDGFRKLRLTDSRSGQTLRLAENPFPDEVFLTALAFSPSGRELAGACSDDTVRIWEIAELLRPASQPRAQRVLRGHGGKVTGVAYSPDGRRLASAGEDGTVRLWDTVEGHELLTLKGHERPVTGVVFSSDGNKILSVSDDRTIKVWIANELQKGDKSN
jgi:WD40 repeat protein